MAHSFHLNLAAMGLLTFVVGIFLTFNALSFSFTDRRELFRRLRLAGVRRKELRNGLLLELGAFLAFGSLLGYWLGALLAARLLPGVGRTLAQLYDVYIDYPDALLPDIGWLLPLAATCSGTPPQLPQHEHTLWPGWRCGSVQLGCALARSTCGLRFP